MTSACTATSSSGSRCGAPALRGREQCLWHDPGQRPAMIEGARLGGRRSRRVKVLPPDSPVMPLRTPEDVQALIERVTDGVLKGTLDDRIADKAVALGQMALKAAELSGLAQRLGKLEAQLAAGASHPYQQTASKRTDSPDIQQGASNGQATQS